MKLTARPINLEVGGKLIVVLNNEDAGFLGLRALDRVKLKCKGKDITAIVDVTKKFTMRGEIVTNDDVTAFFNLKGGEHIEVFPATELESIVYIKQKIAGMRLEYNKIKKIVRDVVDKKISGVELSSFITALHIRGMSIDEAVNLSRAMVEAGKKFKFPGKLIVDKHSVGGLVGDKTSLVFVPIVAASGFTIPKTSSKAITSPCGSAERMEVLAPVDLTLEEIQDVVKKTKGCLVWGGALDIAPADDAFIQIEYPLGIDPLLLPSIMSKKKAIGAHYVVIDIPTGKGTKVKTIADARELADDFIELGNRLRIHVACGITLGDQPLGYSIGPALEAREALLTLQGKGPRDLIQKAATLADILFVMVGAKDSGAALQVLKSGKAEKKFREIIGAQGGNSKIRSDDVPVGEKYAKIKSDKSGKVLWIKNSDLVLIARRAGAPRDRGAGIQLSVKMGDPIKKNQTLFTLHAENHIRLSDAVKLAEELKPIVVGKHFEEKMLLEKVFAEIPARRVFMLER